MSNRSHHRRSLAAGARFAFASRTASATCAILAVAWSLAAAPTRAEELIYAHGFENGKFGEWIVVPLFVQWVQNGKYELSEATIDHVRVTGARGTTNLTYYLQEPQGVTPSEYNYPAWSGIKVFASPTDIAAVPSLGTLAIGDCVTISGTVAEFNGSTQLSSITALVVESAGACGTMPIPLLPLFENVATDIDLVTAGDQAGPSAEPFEGVLMTIQNVFVASADASSFRVRPTNPVSEMLVTGFLHPAFTPPLVSASYLSITGVFDQFGNYRLQPRSGADLVPLN